MDRTARESCTLMEPSLASIVAAISEISNSCTNRSCNAWRCFGDTRLAAFHTARTASCFTALASGHELT
jgi:hypothetical protein